MGKTICSVIICLMLVITSVSFSIALSTNKTIYVDDDGGADYTSIHEIIDNKGVLATIPAISGNVKDLGLQQEYDRLLNTYVANDEYDRNDFDIMADRHYIDVLPGSEPLLGWTLWKEFPGRYKPFFDVVDCFDSGAGELINEIDGGSPSACLEAIDYDGDGDMDYIEGSNEFVFINTNINGNFKKTMIYSFFWSPEPGSGYINSLVYGDIAVGDFNNDGQQDFVTGGICGRIRIFINNGSQPEMPRFVNFSLFKFGQAAYGIDVADFNDDGWLDFAVSSDDRPRTYSTITLFYNNGNLSFTHKDVYQSPEYFIRNLNVGDYDCDGDYDILFTKTIYKWHGGLSWNVIGAYYLLENNGDDTFEPEKLIAERGRDILFYFGASIYLHVQCPIRHYFGFNRINPQMTSADYDNDGDIDFIVGDNSGIVEFFINDGQGNFMSDGVIHRYGHLSWGLSSADFDNDGDIDFIVGALDSYQDYYNGHVWLKRNQLI